MFICTDTGRLILRTPDDKSLTYDPQSVFFRESLIRNVTDPTIKMKSQQSTINYIFSTFSQSRDCNCKKGSRRSNPKYFSWHEKNGSIFDKLGKDQDSNS